MTFALFPVEPFPVARALIAALAACVAMPSAGAPAGRAGSDQTPPLRMGLWQQNHTQTLNGADFQVPDFLIDQAREAGINVSGDGRSERLCVTPQNIASIGAPNDAALPACHKENVRISRTGLSLDLVCGDETGSGRGTVKVIFDSPTYYHGQFDFTGTHELFGDNQLPLELAGKVTGRWLSPSCGAVH